MPLLVNGKILETVPTCLESLRSLLKEDECLMQNAAQFTSSTVRTIAPVGLLYVNQREFAVVKPDDPHIQVLGSEDATTCHLMVVRHSGSGVTALAHLDGCDLRSGISSIIADVKKISHGPEGRLNVYLFGGFLDNRQESLNLSLDIFKLLLDFDEELHLCHAVVTEFNNTIKDGINYPLVYGIAVKVATGEIFRATFPDKGPDMDIRGASHFGGFDKMVNIYLHEEHLLKVGPYTWQAFDNIDQWTRAPDFLIRRYLSTSPEQEPEDFEGSVRKALTVLRDHPSPESIFKDGKPRLYEKQSDGSWRACVTLLGLPLADP